MAQAPADRDRFDEPAALLAIAQAARLAGNRPLELAARKELLKRHGIKLGFAAPRGEVRDAV
jgi:hypothetical protein